jgi:hypothetical protein
MNSQLPKSEINLQVRISRENNFKSASNDVPTGLTSAHEALDRKLEAVAMARLTLYLTRSTLRNTFKLRIQNVALRFLRCRCTCHGSARTFEKIAISRLLMRN